LRICFEAFESELTQWVFILHRLSGRCENQLEIHKSGSCFRVHCRPARLVNDRHIGHLQSGRFSILAKRESLCWYGRDPIQPFRRDRRMEIVKLVCRDRRSLENRESRMGEYSLPSLSSRPIFSCHVAVIRGGISPGKAVAFVVCAHAVETVASRQLSFEMKDVG